MKKPSPFIFSCMWCLIFRGGLAIAQNEVPLTPAEFVSQAVNSDEPAKAYSGSAKERRIRLAERAASRYDFEFDLSGLPEYEPRQMVEGKLRVWGNNYVGDSGLAQQWQDAFTKFHPGIEFEWVLPTGRPM
jgi:phosphate transport system substrate-binding protein